MTVLHNTPIGDKLKSGELTEERDIRSKVNIKGRIVSY